MSRQTLRVQRSQLVCGAFRGMRDQDAKVRERNARISAAQLASSDAGTTSRLGRAASLPLVLALQYQEQREHLDGLAQAHVIGKARPQPAAG